MKILLIEDDKKKSEDIRDYISDMDKSFEVTVKESYQSGLSELLSARYDLLLLDMSMPTWDKSSSEQSGYFEKFGGYKIMREMSRKNKIIKTILVTMFDNFGEADLNLTLSQIDKNLRNDFAGFYIDFVYYNSQENEWKEKLSQLINQLER